MPRSSRAPVASSGPIDTNRFREDEVLAVMDGFGSRELEWVSVSHYDADHLGGIVDVATAPAFGGTATDLGGIVTRMTQLAHSRPARVGVTATDAP
jgi:beta-lactamase superfamily II metal-dependent hydrolase